MHAKVHTHTYSGFLHHGYTKCRGNKKQNRPEAIEEPQQPEHTHSQTYSLILKSNQVAHSSSKIYIYIKKQSSADWPHPSLCADFTQTQNHYFSLTTLLLSSTYNQGMFFTVIPQDFIRNGWLNLQTCSHIKADI